MCFCDAKTLKCSSISSKWVKAFKQSFFSSIFACHLVMSNSKISFLQGYCTEQSDFYSNCQNLSPESELITIYRDSALAERCPLGGLYVMAPQHISPAAPVSGSGDDTAYRSSSGESLYSSSGGSRCTDKSKQESMIMECSDQSMLKLQFSKCTNMPSEFTRKNLFRA